MLGLVAWYLRINRESAQECKGSWLVTCFAGKSSSDKLGADIRECDRPIPATL
ncbi:hypothetical protein [Microcoleus sp. S13_B4]|uniref:hypothetical protein n=1 Tax=Microcoleus sp. S13_B4 TaxID=3055408 RepID=UPI002FD0D51D